MTGSTETCPGCGAVLDAEEGPTHRYMTSSAACWRRFGDLLAAEYSIEALMPTHRLSVDTYAVQHPGNGSRQAIQSVGLHLARLMIHLGSPKPPKEMNNVMLRLGTRKATLHLLERPERFAMTIADVAPFVGTERHAEMVLAWAQCSWDDWSEHHGYIRDWVDAA